MSFLNEKSEAAQKERQLKKQREMEDLLAVMELPQGRNFLVKLLRRNGLHEMLAVSESSVTLRNFALLLLEEIKAAHPGLAREILLKTFDLGEI